jgi:sulfate adenylyltransferase subunit 2
VSGAETDDGKRELDRLEALEAQSIFIMREAFAKFRRLGALWSVGKDSTVMLWLARKAFFGHCPFPLVHIDTSFKIPEMIAYRDRVAKEWGLELIIGQNSEALAAGMSFRSGRLECCAALKTAALQKVIERERFGAVMLGIRRDEDGTRAKERYFSPRNKDFEWNFKDQPPELWSQFQSDYPPEAHVRAHPLLHWTELDIWEYVAREKIPVIDLYFAKNGERYRSLGCAPCTGRVRSTAATVEEVIQELRVSRESERAGRAQDQADTHAMQKLRAKGYM